MAKTRGIYAEPGSRSFSKQTRTARAPGNVRQCGNTSVRMAERNASMLPSFTEPSKTAYRMTDMVFHSQVLGLRRLKLVRVFTKGNTFGIGDCTELFAGYLDL